jgi:hypothetical protein
MTATQPYTKNNIIYTPNTYTKTQYPSQNHPSAKPTPPPPQQQNTQQTKQILITPREKGKCWGCQEPWTHEYKFSYKFRRVFNAISISLDDWLAVEQIMEEENHSLLQSELAEDNATLQPQLLLLFSHAAKGTSSVATFSVIISMGAKRGLTLVDSGSTDTFLDYTFASKGNCNIIATPSKAVKVAEGGQLETNAVTSSTMYFIQKEAFTGTFKPLQLKGYDVILGCDWIKAQNPIGLDLRDNSRQLTIYKEGKKNIVFHDHNPPPPH